MAWYEILAPTGLPQSIVNQLAAASDKALSDPALIEKLNSLSIQPTPGITGNKASQFVKQDIEKLSVTIKTLGVRLD
jgi:tripartite-type tricarboxylate transporter receptor subunit TctC